MPVVTCMSITILLLLVRLSLPEYANTPCGKGICVTPSQSAELTGAPYSLGVIEYDDLPMVDINWVNFSFFFPVPTAYEMGTTPDTLAHVLMKYIDPSEPLAISFNQALCLMEQ